MPRLKPSLVKNTSNIVGNKTILQYLEDFFGCYEYNIGPSHGMFICNKEIVPSGPHYLGIYYCKLYNKKQ